jgi:hypothetical protein
LSSASHLADSPALRCGKVVEARDAADHGVFGVHAVAEKEAQVGGEIVDVHAARQIDFGDQRNRFIGHHLCGGGGI